jgi:peptide deformylase
MLLKILQTGEHVLRQKARELSREEILSPEIQTLIQSMQETMRHAPGVGLAAPQIGKSLQLAVIEDREEYTRGVSPEQLAERGRSPVDFHVIINPRIALEPTPRVEFFEGCLSIGGFVGIIPRATAVTVTCLNEKAEEKTIKATGWYARILQHEIEHLQGRLCLDRVKLRSFMTIDNYMQYWRDKSLLEIKKELGVED